MIGNMDKAAQVQQIAELQRQSLLEAALAATDSALAQWPDDHSLTMKRGVILRQMQRAQESVAALARLVARTPGDVNAMHELALSLRANGDHERSLAVSGIALVYDPEHRASLIARIDTNIQTGNFEAALCAADAALKTRPEDRHLAMKHAVVLRHLRRSGESVAALAPLVARNPADLGLKHELALSLRAAGDHDRSLAVSSIVLARDPRHRASLLARIDTNIQAQDYDAALAAAEQALAVFPDDRAAGLKRGAMLRRLGRKEDSIGHFQAMVNARPEDKEVRFQLAVSLREAGHYARAARLFESVLEDDPLHPGAVAESLNEFIRDHRLDDALALADRILAKTPANTAIGLKRSAILFHMGNDQAQISQLRDILRRDPGSPHAASALCSALNRRFDLDEALSVAMAFIDVADSSPAVLRQKLRFCRDYGELSTLSALTRQWADAEPEDPEALLAVYSARILSLDLTGLDPLEERLMQKMPGSEALAIARADRRLAELDVKGAVGLLKAFLSDNAPARRVRLHLFNLLWRMNDLEACKAILDTSLQEMPDRAIAMASCQYGLSEWEDARAMLRHAEPAIRVMTDPTRKTTLMRQVHGLYARMDNKAALRIQDEVLSWNYVRADTRRYFSRHGVPETTAPAPQGPPIRDIIVRNKRHPEELSPDHIALADRITRWAGANREMWFKTLLRSSTVSRYLNACYLDFPENFAQLDEIVSCPNADALFAHSRAKEPFLVTSSHQGPHVVAWWLHKTFPDLRIIANRHPIGAERSVSSAPLMIDGTAPAHRELLTLLNAGTPIAGTLDQPFKVQKKFSDPKNTLKLSLFGAVDIHVSSFLPRLAWKRGLPSYWMDAELDGNRLRLNAVRLADPDPAADWDTWSRRWMTDYAAQLERYLRRGPEHWNRGPLPNCIIEEFYKTSRGPIAPFPA